MYDRRIEFHQAKERVTKNYYRSLVEKGGASMKGKGTDKCDGSCVHGKEGESVNLSMPLDEKIADLADFFKIFGDVTRIKILYVLFQSEMCVCDIASFLNMTQSAISHQLRVLKQMKLVVNRREGKTVFYSLADGHIKTIMNQGMEHIEE